MLEESVEQCVKVDYVYHSSGSEGPSSPQHDPETNSPGIQDYINGMNAQKDESPSKRKRKRDTGPKTPAALSPDTFPQVIVAFCLQALDPKFDIHAWLGSRRPEDDTVPGVGLSQRVVMPIHTAFTKPPIELVKAVMKLNMIDPDHREYSKLYTLFTSIMHAHSFKLIWEFDPTGMVCFVKQEAAKGTQRLAMMELHQHEKQDARSVVEERLVVKNPPAMFTVSAKYAELCLAVWYLLLIEQILGKNILDWLDKRVADDPEYRTSRENGVIIKEFMDENEKGLKKVYDHVVYYLGIVKKDYKQRVQKINAHNRQMEAEANGDEDAAPKAKARPAPKAAKPKAKFKAKPKADPQVKTEAE